jgi:hypothetical protein
MSQLPLTGRRNHFGLADRIFIDKKLDLRQSLLGGIVSLGRVIVD